MTTRERMVVSAALLVREKGARATSIEDVLAHSRAPRGSVYHHFPGGRDQLLREATAFAGEHVAGRLELGDDPLAALDAFIAGYRADLERSGMRSGCPVLAVAIEADSGLQGLAGDIFVRWQDQLARAFAGHGADPARARQLAVLVVAAVEGALVLARAQHDLAPLDSVRAQLHDLLEGALTR